MNQLVELWVGEEDHAYRSNFFFFFRSTEKKINDELLEEKKKRINLFLFAIILSMNYHKFAINYGIINEPLFQYNRFK